jgi:2-haloacid dehalogenase
VVHQRGLDEGRIGDAVSIAAALPVFGDVAPALDTLLTSGHRLAVLTNSGAESGRRTLEAAGLQDQFERILGVDAVQKFKPHPDTYAHALRELGREPGQITFVSAHAWDLAGAHHAGMRTALVRRGDPLPPVFPAPDVQGDDLSDVAERLPAPRR